MHSDELKVLIVDDEPIARQRLRRALAGMGAVRVVGEAGNADEAIEAIERYAPNLLFLDIRMPGIDGVEMLRQLGDAAPLVVIVTAFDHFALQAFDLHAVDYVLKPIEAARVEKAVARAARLVATADGRCDAPAARALPRSGRSMARTTSAAEFWIRGRDGYRRIDEQSIYWIEAERDYVRLHLKSGSYLLSESLVSLERRLDPRDFVRIHRTAIVRWDRIAMMRRGGFGALHAVLEDGHEVRVGRTYEKGIRALVGARRTPCQAPHGGVAKNGMDRLSEGGL